MRQLALIFVVGATLLLVWQYVANWHTIHGLVAYSLGDTEGASLKFQRAIDKNQNNIYALFYLGRLHYEQGSYSQAIPYLQKVVQQVPVHHAAHMLVADAYSAQSEHVSALQSARHALLLQPGNTVYHFHLGLIHKGRGHYLEAVKAFQQAISLGSDDRDLLYHLAYVYFQLGQFELAVQHFNQALSLYPDDFGLHLQLARSYRALNRADASIRKYQQASALGKDDFFAAYELATLYQSDNQLDAAYHSLLRAKKLNPQYTDIPGSLFSLGFAFKSQQQLKQAISAISQAVESEPDNAEYHYQLGLLYKDDTQYVRAVTSLRNAQRLGFSGGDLLFNLAYSLINLDQEKEALQALYKLLEVSPNHKYAHAELARIYLRQGDIGKAIAEFKVDISLSPENFFSYYDLGLLYQSSGELLQAKKQLEIALKLNPGYPYTCAELQKVERLLNNAELTDC